MGIIVDGTLDTIKRNSTSGDKVIFLNALYINGKKYVFASDTESDAEMDPYQKTHQTTFKMTYPGDKTAPNSKLVCIGKDLMGEIISNDGTKLSSYNIVYTKGLYSNTASIYFRVYDGVDSYEQGKLIEYIDLQQVEKGATKDQTIITFEYTYTPPVTYTETRELSQIQEYDNLFVPGDTLVSNNLEVGGSINDLTLYYDTIYTDSLITDLGFGMLAKFYDSKYTINNIEYKLPLFQLSPGLSYSTENVTISWLADGQLLLESKTSDPITNISFAPRILRYE